MTPDQLKGLLRWAVPRLLLIVAILVVLFVLGVVAGRQWFPRTITQPVAERLIREAPAPGAPPKIIPYPVPQPYGVPTPAPYPVEIPVTVFRPCPERIVTITRPVNVPVEVIREVWPQTITVRVGSVLSEKDEWVIPKFSDLLIGQVAPGVYAVPADFPGWKVETVRTETRVVEPPPAPARVSVEIRPTFGMISLGGHLAAAAGGKVVLTRDHWVWNLAGGASTAGPWGMLFVDYRF